MASNAGGVGKNRDLSQYLAQFRAVNASTAKCNIHSAATDHGKLITLVAGKSLLMAGDDDEVYDKKPQRYVEDNRAAFNCMQW